MSINEPLLPGLAWVPGVNAVELQRASGLKIDSKTLSYTCTAEIHVAQKDTWRAIHGFPFHSFDFVV